MVSARVARLGFSGEKKALNPVEVAGATVFANSYRWLVAVLLESTYNFRFLRSHVRNMLRFTSLTHSFPFPERSRNPERGIPLTNFAVNDIGKSRHE